MNYLSVLDIVLLAVILLCAGDALRQLNPFHHPIRSVAFGLVTTGSFGWIGHNAEGFPVQWWALLLHAGFAIYALLLFVGRNPLGLRHVGTSRGSVRRVA
ncbi:hypothetical protein DyAD56_15930 [Dyella sp. AD56]|nr:hypothetical protein DyAD56_15930 [Dyella sp. AD56]